MKGRHTYSKSLTVGLTLMAFAFFLYLAYHLTGGGEGPLRFVAPPLGVALFAAGFYLARSSVRIFQRLERAFRLLVAGTLLLWLFYAQPDLVNLAVGSALATSMSTVAAQIGTGTLNILGVQARLSGDSIIFPAGSKLSAVTIGNACSGVQATTAFLGAYTLMLIDIGRKTEKRMLLALALIGVGMVYLVNLARLTTLALIGYFMGFVPLDLAHTYLDFAIFLGEVTVFWYVSLRWTGTRSFEQHRRNPFPVA